LGAGGGLVGVDESARPQCFGDAEAGGAAVVRGPRVLVPFVAGGGVGVQADREGFGLGRVREVEARLAALLRRQEHGQGGGGGVGRAGTEGVHVVDAGEEATTT